MSEKTQETDQFRKTTASLRQQIFEQKSEMSSLMGVKAENERMHGEIREREMEIDTLRRKLLISQNESDDLKQAMA